MQVECRVKYTAGAYVTNTVRGCRGSSTMDAATAVERLAQRLLGGRSRGFELVSRGEGCTSTWRITGEDEKSE